MLAALAGPYLTALAQDAVGERGTLFAVGPLRVTAEAWFPYVTSASVLLQVLVLPVLGAAADGLGLQRRLLGLTCALGATATALLGLRSGWLVAGLLFLAANLAFGASLVVYNAFLPQLAAPEDRDRVSSGGYALGYAGGALLLALNLALVTGAGPLGLSRAAAVRLALASAGVWWAVFGLWSVRRLRRPVTARRTQRVLRTGLVELRASVRALRGLPGTLRYLAAYLLFNDAIQAVIGLASVVLTQELFVARGRPSADAAPFLLSLILLIQVVAVGGALGFARLAARIGARNAVAWSLVGWLAVVVYTWAFLSSLAEAYALGVVIALVLGGSQALSRSLFSRLVPAGREAAFFGFYEISERGTAWLATALFGVVLTLTGSYRQALLSVAVLLGLGLVLLLRTDTAAAEQAAAGSTATSFRDRAGRRGPGRAGPRPRRRS